MHTEHITLQPHALDHWRRALDVLIACAPGHPADVANHLRDASMGMNAKPQPTAQEKSLVLRLLIAADVALHASRTAHEEEPRDVYGFTLHAPLIGTDLSAFATLAQQPVGQPGAAPSDEHAARTEPLASSLPATNCSSIQDRATPESPSLQPGAASHVPGHESALPSATGESRPSGDSSCR